MLKETLIAALATTLAGPLLGQDEQPKQQAPTEPTEAKVQADKAEKMAQEGEEEKELSEFAVKAAPFCIKTEISGILVPSKTQSLTLAPKQWKSFVIESIPKHGSAVKTGDPLIVFKTDSIDKALIEQEASIETKELKLAIANRELTALQQKNVLSLAAAKQKMDNAESDLSYYESTGLQARKDDLKQSLQQAEDYLTYQKEELNQLLKMYEEDDITEETEEIILVRQRAQVRDAENNLTSRKRRNGRALEANLPRELQGHKNSVEKARIEYATAKLNLERNYKLKSLEVAKLERDLTASKDKLAEMKADREFFNVTAEFDGHLVYGAFVEGQWKKGKLPEILKPSGTAPLQTPILTLVANDSPLTIEALVESKKARELRDSLATAGENAPNVNIASYPNTTGKHLLTLEPKVTEFQFPGEKDKADLVFYETESALTIPTSAVKTKEDGSSYVTVKLSEGDPEERPVELGKENGKVVEVLSGLEEGQVILR